MKEEIIVRFLNGECTPEEIKLVWEWQKNPSFKKEFDEILESRWDQLCLSDPSDLVYDKLPQEIHDILYKDLSTSKSRILPKNNPIKKERKFNYSYYLMVAAVFFIFLFSAYITIYFLKVDVPEKPLIVKVNQIKKEALIGQKLRFQLLDGTKVVLNSGSSLEFPEEFSDTLREVKLVGEAFFEVRSDVSRPFRVSSNSATTTVLGTIFNINEKEEGARITLKEGKVKVEFPKQSENQKNVMLYPGEMAIVNSLAGDLIVEQVDVHEQTAWQKGIISFKNRPLKDIFSQLEMWYNVDFEISKKVNQSSQVSGEFANENLENILSGLSFSFNFQYTISGNKVKIN